MIQLSECSTSSEVSSLFGDEEHKDILIPTVEVTKNVRVSNRAFASIYEGTWQKEGTLQKVRVTIKEMHGHLSQCIIDCCLSEIRILKKLQHAHVVRLCGITANPDSLVMEFLSGGTLFKNLQSHQPMEWPLKEQIALDITRGLTYLHEHGVLYYTLTSDSVSLDEMNRAKLTDYGLSKLKVYTTRSLSKPHQFMLWTAPELLNGTVQENTTQCNIYSLSVIFWEIITRHLPPRYGLDETQVISAIQRKEYPVLPPETSLPMSDVIQATWHYDPAKRTNLDKVIDRLEKGLANLYQAMTSTDTEPASSSHQNASSSQEVAKAAELHRLGFWYENGQEFPMDITKPIAPPRVEFTASPILSSSTSSPIRIIPHSSVLAPIAPHAQFRPPVVAAGPSARERVAVPPMAFGKMMWEHYFGDVGEEPPLPSIIETILQSPCPFNSDQRVGETHVLTLIPASVDGVPYSLNLLIKLIQNPKNRGHKPSLSSQIKRFKKRLGSIVISRSYWVLMTRDVIKGTTWIGYDKKLRILNSKVIGITWLRNGGPPTALEAVTSISMEYVRSGINIHRNVARTPMYCRDARIKSTNIRVVVESRSSHNITLSEDDSSSIFFWNPIGLAWARAFR